MSLQTECMVLNMQVGLWMGYRLDKTTTKKVTDEADAAPDAARVNKHIIPKEALKDIVQAGGAVRTHFYTNTLPWKDNGDRLITRSRFITFMPEYQLLVEKFTQATEDFLITKYITAMSQAEFRMGELFNASDYPTIGELRHKFYVNLDIDGVAIAYDFRLNDNESVIQARVTQAMEGLWEKLAKPLEHFAEKMGEDGAIRLHETTLTNLRAVADAIPDLNFLQDPKLDIVRERVIKMIGALDIKELRKDTDARKALSDEATDILEGMRGFMTAMGNG